MTLRTASAVAPAPSPAARPAKNVRIRSRDQEIKTSRDQEIKTSRDQEIKRSRDQETKRSRDQEIKGREEKRTSKVPQAAETRSRNFACLGNRSELQYHHERQKVGEDDDRGWGILSDRLLWD